MRPAPDGYHWVKSVIGAICEIERLEDRDECISIIDIDHDAGGYAVLGGDYIEVLNWLEETGRDYPIRIHSNNGVGIANMRRIIQRNGWKEVF